MSEKVIDPFTGLEVVKSGVVDPFTGLSYDTAPVKDDTPIMPSSTEMFLDGDPNSYLSYGVPVLPGLDIDEMRAQRQSRAEKWGRGLMKAGVTTAMAFTENTLGALNGIGEAIYYRDWTKLADNTTGRAVDSVNAWMQDNFRNYYTKEEQEAIGLENLGYANFWGDKAANGLGYAVASVASLYATGGVGIVTRGLGLAAKGAKAAVGAAAATKAGSRAAGIYRASKAIATAEKLYKTASSSAKVRRGISAAKQAEVGISMSHAEAAVEAREALKHAEETMLDQIAAEKGVDRMQLSQSDRERAREEASKIGNAVYASNMAVLAPTNLAMFGGLFKSKFKASRSSLSGFTKDAKSKQWLDMWSADNAKAWQRTASRYLQNPAKDAVTEAFQEGTQFAIGQAAGAAAEGEGYSSVLDWLGAIGEGGNEILKGDKEGIESVLLGAIIGGFMGGVQSGISRYGKTEEDAQRKKVLDRLNSPTLYKVVDNAEFAKNQEAILKKMQDSLESGDHKGYRDAQLELIQENVLFHERNGSIDMFMERIDDAKYMEKEEFAKAFGLPENSDFDHKQIVSDLTQDVKNLVQIKRELDAIAPGQETTGLPRLLTSKDVLEEEKDRLTEEYHMKDFLVRNKSRLLDADGRISKMRAELMDLFNPLSKEERAVAERTIKRLTYNSSKIRRLQKKEREQGLSEGEKEQLASLLAEVDRNEAALEAEEVTDDQLGADKQSYKERLIKPKEEREDKVEPLSPELREALNNITKSISDPSDRLKAEELARDISRLAGDRTQAAYALNELLSNPERRAGYIRRQMKTKEEAAQKEIDKYADNSIASTTTSAELYDLGILAKDKGVSPAARKKLNDEYKRRQENEEVVAVRLNLEDLPVLKKKKQELEAKKEKEELTPEEKIELFVLDTIIPSREALGEQGIEGNRSRQKKAQEAARKKAEEEAAARAAADAKKEADKANQTNDSSTNNTTNPDNDGSRNPRSPSPFQSELYIVNGEFQLKDITTDKNGNTIRRKAVVFKNGEPVPGTDVDPAHPRTIDRGFLKTEEGYKEVMEKGVEFEHVRSTKDNKNLEYIYVKLAGTNTYLGFLPNPMSQGSKTSNLLMELIAGNKVTAKVNTIEYAGKGNFLAETNDQGEPVFKPVSEVLGEDVPPSFVGLGIVQKDNITVIAQNKSDQEINEAQENLNLRRDSMELTAGQVVMVVKLPNGDYTALTTSTKTLGEEGYGRLVDIIAKKGEGNTVSEIKALLGIPNNWIQGKTSFFVTQLKNSGKVIFNFEHKGAIIGMSYDEVSGMLESGAPKFFSYGKMVEETTDEGDVVTVFEREKPKKEGGNASTAEYQRLKEGMLESFKAAAMNSRVQVSKKALQELEGAYTDPVTGKTYASYQEFAIKELLTTSNRFHKGLPTYDHRVSMSVNVQEGANTSETTGSSGRVKPENTEGKKKNTTKKRKGGAGTKHNFGEPTNTEPTSNETKFNPSNAVALTPEEEAELMASITGEGTTAEPPSKDDTSGADRQTRDHRLRQEREAVLQQSDTIPEGDYIKGKTGEKTKDVLTRYVRGYLEEVLTLDIKTASYDAMSKNLVLTLQPGDTELEVRVPMHGMVLGGSVILDVDTKQVINAYFDAIEKAGGADVAGIVSEEEARQLEEGIKNAYELLNEAIEVADYEGIKYQKEYIEAAKAKWQKLFNTPYDEYVKSNTSRQSLAGETDAAFAAEEAGMGAVEDAFVDGFQPDEEAGVPFVWEGNEFRIFTADEIEIVSATKEFVADQGKLGVDIYNGRSFSFASSFKTFPQGLKDEIKRIGDQNASDVSDVPFSLKDSTTGEVSIDTFFFVSGLHPNGEVGYAVANYDSSKLSEDNRRFLAQYLTTETNIPDGKNMAVKQLRENMHAVYIANEIPFAELMKAPNGGVRTGRGGRMGVTFLMKSSPTPETLDALKKRADLLFTRSIENINNKQYVEDLRIKVNGKIQVGPPSYSLKSPSTPKRGKMEQTQAVSWLRARFGKDSVSIYTNMKKVGSAVVHGYMENAAVHLWSNAEVGTEYHEGYHLFFRTLLNDKQREAIYLDALAEFGEPTAEDIEKAKRGQLNITNKEARLLALEEKMADAFRDYVLSQKAPKSFGQRLVKFFKDLYAYIKAFAGKPVAMRQAFRLIESNRIPASYSRTAQAFSPGAAFMMKQYAADPQTFRELRDIAIYKALNEVSASGANMQDLLGSPETANVKGGDSTIRNWFLRSAFHKDSPDIMTGGRTREPISDREFGALQRAYDDPQQFQAVLSDYNIKLGAPEFTHDGEVMPSQMIGEEAADNAQLFLEVYEHWHDKRGELGGVNVRGFRTDIRDRLRDYGFKIYDSEQARERGEVNDKEEGADRNYSVSYAQTDPAAALGDKARRVLSRIPVKSTSESYFGFETYMPIEDIYHEIQTAVVGSESYVDMMEKLKSRSSNISSLTAVYDFIQNLSTPEKALLYSVFSQAMTPYKMIVVESSSSSQPGKPRKVVKIIDSSSKSIERYFTAKWAEQATSVAGIYKVSVSEDGDILDIQANQARLGKALKHYKNIVDLKGTGDRSYEELADMLLALGINIAKDRETAARRVKEALQMEGISVSNFIKRPNTNLKDIMENPNKLGKLGKANYPNIFQTESTTMATISKVIMSKFEAPVAASFFNGLGNLIFPINLKNDMNITSEMVKDVSSEGLQAIMEGEEGSKGTVGSYIRGKDRQGNEVVYNSLAHMMISTKAGKESFEIVDIDSKREGDERAVEYDNFDYNEGLSVDLIMFGSSKDKKYIAIDTQGDRSKLSYMAIDNILNSSVRSSTGFQVLGDNPLEAAIERTYLLDLHRIRVAEKTIESTPDKDLIAGYHDGRYKALQFGGEYRDTTNIAHDAYLHMEMGKPMTKELKKAVKEYVAEVVNRMETTYLEEILKEVGGEERLRLLVANSVQPGNGYVVGKEIEFVKDYIKMNVVGRVISRELLRNGVHFTSGGANYNKRSHLSGTPGRQFFTLSMNMDGTDYGMLDEFREITIADNISNMEEENPEAYKRLRDAIAAQSTEEAADIFMQGYKKSNGTDAQGMITIHFHRRLGQGLGLWTAVDEQVYKEYMSKPKGQRIWDGERSPIRPWKTSYDFRVLEEFGGYNHLMAVSHKNSYVVMTDELVEGVPQMKKLNDWMESNNVHVANSVEAKKLGSFRAVTAANLEEARIQTLPSRGLKVPQILPEKNTQKTTFGRQPRKNMIANINPTETYYLRDSNKLVTGRELIDIYQKAVVAKLNQGHDKVVQDLGYDEVMNATTEAEQVAALNKMIPKLRELLTEIGVEKDLPQNIMDALDVVADENGVVTTLLPASFPSIQLKLDSIVMNLFRKNAYLMKMTGVEMVQFGEYGGHEKDGTLKFYDIDNSSGTDVVVGAEVDIRYDVLQDLGIDPEDPNVDIDAALNRLLGYRVPQQGKSSTLMMRVRKILPKSHPAAVKVPPGVTTMMGSDFDVDKMFVIFPELEVQESNQKVKVTKVRPDYNKLTGASQEDFNSLDSKVINNIIFDTFEAIGGNINHIHETLAPLDLPAEHDPVALGLLSIRFDQQTLDSMTVAEKRAESKVKIDINSTSGRIRSSADNQLSAALRGIYANAIAGRNVAIAAQEMSGGQLSWKPDESEYFEVDGVRVGELTEKAKFQDSMGVFRFTDYYMSNYLSKAVDSVKNPIQGLINDNRITAALTTYMLSIGMTPEQAILFLNVPVIRNKVQEALSKGLSLKQVVKIGATRKDPVKPVPMKLSSEEMKEIIHSDKPYGEKNYLDMLMFMSQQSTKLDTLYKLLSPDKIDKIGGTTQAHLALIDAASNQDAEVFGGLESLKMVTEGDAYPIVRAMYAAMERSLDVTTALGFISRQPSVQKFKKDIKKITNKEVFNANTHRDINKAILHHLVTKPGSPLFEKGHLDVEFIFPTFVRGDVAKLLKAMQDITGGTSNPVVDAFSIAEEPMPNGQKFTYLQVDKTQLSTKEQKDQFTMTLQGMIDDLGLYGEENIPFVRMFVKTVITNSILTTGFSPGLKSYFELIPVGYLSDLGVREHLNQEMLKLGTDENALEDFKAEFLSSYGTHYFRGGGGGYLFNRSKLAGNIGSVEQSPGDSEWVIKTKGKHKFLYKRINQGDTNYGSNMSTYGPVITKGKQHVFYEANLRFKGEKYNRSLFQAEDQILEPPSRAYTSVFRTTDTQQSRNLDSFGFVRDTPRGAREKIARLRTSFAKAGVTVSVVEASLPLGVKGEVRNGVVYVDPAQITEDTTYHEFGHILIDMLPQDQVDRYIEEVKKSDPALAETVAASYPELEGRDLGKEILVTAIGIQGAKIERKNPSKLQILINRILRAIGKLFGIKPSIAAVLAEEMFAGDIKRELSGEFNPSVQKSKRLQNKLNKVYNQVRDSLERQRIRLKGLPESKSKDGKMRDVSALINNIDQMKEKLDSNTADLNEFFDFHQYVVGRVTILENMMDDIRSTENESVDLDTMYDRLNKIEELRKTLESLYNEEESSSTVTLVKDLLSTMRQEGLLDQFPDETRDLLVDLDSSLTRLRELNEDYYKDILPMTTKTLLQYASPEAAAAIEQEKSRVEESGDLSGFRPFTLIERKTGRYGNKMPEFIQLNNEYFSDESTMTREEFDEEAMKLKLKYLDSKLVGKAQLDTELTEAMRSKSYFSYMLDPIVYSRQQNLQLFALALKDALNKANDESLDFIYNMEDKFEKFKEWKGGSELNAANLYEDLLTNIKIRVGDKTINALSLVQQFNVDDYYGKYYNYIDAISKKYNKPAYDSDPELKEEWFKSEEALLYNQAKLKWFRDNTEPVEKAAEKYKAALKEANALEDRMKMLSKEDNPANREQILLLQADYYKAQNRLKKMGKFDQESGRMVYMGELAKPNKSYESDKWKKIQATPEMKEFYDYIVSNYARSQKIIGESGLRVNSWDEFSYVMPSVRKDGLGTLVEDGWKEFKNEIGRDFRRLDTDTEFGMMTSNDGQEIRGIPKYYTNPVDEKNISRDVAASMSQFVHMANTYKEKSKIAGLVASMLALHERKGVIKYQSGVPVMDQVANIARKAAEHVTKRGSEDNLDLKHLKDFVDSVFYGVVDVPDISADAQKTMSKIIGFTAVVGLAGNVLQIGNQAILDNNMTAREAFTKQFFKPDVYADAVKTYLFEQGLALQDVGAFRPKGKLARALQSFDGLVDVENVFANVGSNKVKKLINKKNLYFAQGGVEHQTASVRMLAVLKSTVAKDKDGNVIMKDGKEANIWDMLIESESGRLVIDPKVANVTKSQLIARIHGLSKRTNQVKGSFDRAMAQRTATGKFLLLFRNYLIPGLRARFGHGDMLQVDHELGAITRGSYKTGFDFLRSMIENKLNYTKVMSMMSEIDKQNMRRNLYDVMTVTLTMMMYNLLKGIADDDDENYLAAFGAYQARRLYTETTAFLNPMEGVRMLMRPVASVNLVEDAFMLAYTGFRTAQYEIGAYSDEEEILKDIQYQRRSGANQKGDSKFIGRMKKVFPFLRTWDTVPWVDGSPERVMAKLKFFE